MKHPKLDTLSDIQFFYNIKYQGFRLMVDPWVVFAGAYLIDHIYMPSCGPTRVAA